MDGLCYYELIGVQAAEIKHYLSQQQNVRQTEACYLESVQFFFLKKTCNVTHTALAQSMYEKKGKNKKLVIKKLC